MWTKKQNKIICLFLVVIMLLSGICFENVQADSLFSYEYCKSNTSTMDSSKKTPDDPIILVEDLFGSRDALTSIRQTRNADEKTGPRTDLYLSFVDILPQNSTFFRMAASEGLSDEILSNTVILNYIHQKDGKKD